MSNNTFTTVALNKLPPPTIVEPLDFETIFAAMLSDLQLRDPGFNAVVESDPVFKVLEVAAYRELLLRQRINEAAKGIMLAFALGSDLDQIGANYNVPRLVITPADPNTVPPAPAVFEADEDYRDRIQLAFEGISTAGPEGAYIFHTLKTDPDIKSVTVKSPNPGEVLVTVLTKTGNGEASTGLLNTIDAALNADDVRPLTDLVTVQSAQIINYAVDAVLHIFDTANAGLIQTAAQQSLDDYVENRHTLGLDVARSGLLAALHVTGVEKVDLITPAADIPINDEQAGFCTSKTVSTA